MKVFKVTLMVIDHDEIGQESVQYEIKNARYANHCIHPQVVAIDGRDIGEWRDEHPLNLQGNVEHFNKIFGGVK